MKLKEVRKMPFAKGGVCISPDGQTMIAMSGQTTRIIRMADDTTLAAFNDLKYAYRAAFSPDRETIAVKSVEPKIGFYSLKTLMATGKIQIRKNNSAQDEGFCFSHDGKYFYNIVHTDDFRTHLVMHDTGTLRELQTFFTDNRSVLPKSIRYIPEKGLYLLHGYYRSGRHYALWLDNNLECVQQIALGKYPLNFEYLSESDEFIAEDTNKLIRFDAKGRNLGDFYTCLENDIVYGLSVSTAGNYFFCRLSNGFIVFSTKDFSPLYQHTTEWYWLTTTPDDRFVYASDLNNCTLFEICPDTLT